MTACLWPVVQTGSDPNSVCIPSCFAVLLIRPLKGIYPWRCYLYKDSPGEITNRFIFSKATEWSVVEGDRPSFLLRSTMATLLNMYDCGLKSSIQTAEALSRFRVWAEDGLWLVGKHFFHYEGGQQAYRFSQFPQCWHFEPWLLQLFGEY